MYDNISFNDMLRCSMSPNWLTNHLGEFGWYHETALVPISIGISAVFYYKIKEYGQCLKRM